MQIAHASNTAPRIRFVRIVPCVKCSTIRLPRDVRSDAMQMVREMPFRSEGHGPCKQNEISRLFFQDCFTKVFLEGL